MSPYPPRTSPKYYDSTYYNGHYVFDYAAAGDPPNLVTNYDSAEGEWWGGEVTMTQAVGRTHRVVVGAEYKNDLEQEQNNHDLAVYLADKRDTKNWALYAQDEVALGGDCSPTWGCGTVTTTPSVGARVPAWPSSTTRRRIRR